MTTMHWLWSFGGWIYNYLCNQCISTLKLRVRIPHMRGVLDTTFCDKVCQCLKPLPQVGGFLRFSLPMKQTTNYKITDILLKEALNTITLTPTMHCCRFWAAKLLERNVYEVIIATQTNLIQNNIPQHPNKDVCLRKYAGVRDLKRK